MLDHLIISFNVIAGPYRRVKLFVKGSAAFDSIVQWRSRRNGNSKRMQDVFYDFANSECEDFRDRVFGVLGLVEGGETFPVDYSDSSRAIFFKILQHFDLQRDYDLTSGFIMKLKSALNLERGLEKSRDTDTKLALKPSSEEPVRTWLTNNLAVDARLRDLRSHPSKIFCCTSPCCRERRLRFSEYNHHEKSSSFTSVLAQGGELSLCHPQCISSSLGFLLLHTLPKAYVVVAAVEVGEEWATAYGMGLTLYLHGLSVPKFKVLPRRLRRSAWNWNDSTVDYYVEVSPEIVEAMLFFYSGSSSSSNATFHKSNAWSQVWPAGPDGTTPRSFKPPQPMQTSQIPHMFQALKIAGTEGRRRSERSLVWYCYMLQLFSELNASMQSSSRYTDAYKPIHRSGARLKHLTALTQTVFSTMADIGVETWIVHGNLLGWWWNQRVLPWNSDLDVQISGPSLTLLDPQQIGQVARTRLVAIESAN